MQWGKWLTIGSLALVPACIAATPEIYHMTRPSYTLEGTKQIAMEKLPEYRAEQLRKIPVELWKYEGGMDFKKNPDGSCHDVKIYLNKKPDPSTLSHEFSHVVYDCDLSESKRSATNDRIDSLIGPPQEGITAEQKRRRYSEFFADTYTNALYRPDILNRRGSEPEREFAPEVLGIVNSIQ